MRQGNTATASFRDLADTLFSKVIQNSLERLGNEGDWFKLTLSSSVVAVIYRMGLTVRDSVMELNLPITMKMIKSQNIRGHCAEHHTVPLY